MEQTKTTQQNPLAKAPIPKLMLKFALPSVISLLVNALYNIVDQIFIGQGVGYLGNGATNVIFPITVIAMALALMFGDGGAAYLSLKNGQGDKEQAEKGVCSSITMLIILSIFCFTFGLIFLEPIAKLFGATAEILPYALDYGSIIIMGIPFVIISTGLNSIIRADGSPKTAMMSMLVGAVTNTILDPLFIFVLGWGVKGAALATILGQILTLLISALYIPRFKTVKITLKKLIPDPKTVLTVASFGISSFITQIAVTIAIFFINGTLVKYGAMSRYGANIPLTALGIVMKVNQILMSVIIGIGIGSQPIIGFNYGAGNLHRVRKTYFTAVTAATVVSVLGFLLFQFGQQPIIALFGSEEALYNEFATRSFKTFLGACFLNGAQISTGIFFQAIGKPLKSTLISMSRQIIFLIPSILLLPMIYGVDGALFAGPVADAAAFLVAMALILFEMKKMRKREKTFHEKT